MRAIFKGGPWDGYEIDFPVLPERLGLTKTLWHDRSGQEIQNTMVLASPIEITYVLRRDRGELCYEVKATTMEVDGVPFRQEGRQLWIGDISSQRFGHLEVVLTGDVIGPNEGQLSVFRRFVSALDSNIYRMRSKITFGFLYRPIRIAPNMENRVGVQFRNRITGNQATLILEPDP